MYEICHRSIHACVLAALMGVAVCADPPLAATGEALAKTTCAACHAYPEPALLDQLTWKNHVLPRMGFMLGVLPADSVGATFIEPEAEALAFANPNIFRKNATISKEDQGKRIKVMLKEE